MRAFIAIEIPDKVKQAIQEVHNRLKPLDAKQSLRWVPPENLHMTLAFLGETEPKTIARIGEELDQVLSTVNYSVGPALGDTGIFPGRGRPKVFYVGMDEPNGRLNELKSRVDQVLTEVGLKTEKRRFVPHLTFARIRRRRPPVDFVNAFIGMKMPEVRFSAKGVTIFESKLHSSGAVYTVNSRHLFG